MCVLLKFSLIDYVLFSQQKLILFTQCKTGSLKVDGYFLGLILNIFCFNLELEVYDDCFIYI